MKQLTLDLKIKHETEIDEIDLWDFDNFDWLKGNRDCLREFFTDAIPRMEKLILENPGQIRYRKLKIDCRRRLSEIKANCQNN